MDFTSILGVSLTRLGFSEVIEACEKKMKQRQGGYVCFANVHTVTESTYHPALQRALNGATFSVADGMPLVWVSRMKHSPVRSRVCGPDFMAAFFKKNPDSNYGMIGGAPGQAEQIARLFGIQATCYSPPIRPFSEANALEDWKNFVSLCPEGRPPAMVWVGLGAPKQELWMQAASREAPETLFMGVGAAFDFLAQRKKRAPVWMQDRGLEWLYRLSQEPGRLWKRYLVTNSMFVGLVTLDLTGLRRIRIEGR
jgi:N-acetylglucosaminyldiphosphoundecaprenol N-acetyl-beta-D-mannosaminyltransferase